MKMNTFWRELEAYYTVTLTNRVEQVIIARLMIYHISPFWHRVNTKIASMI